MKRFYSTGEAAKLIGVHRDKVQSAIRSGLPEPEELVGNRRLFNRSEVLRLCDWLEEDGTAVTRPDFSEDLTPVA